jgi:hypothetical protein
MLRLDEERFAGISVKTARGNQREELIIRCHRSRACATPRGCAQERLPLTQARESLLPLERAGRHANNPPKTPSCELRAG